MDAQGARCYLPRMEPGDDAPPDPIDAALYLKRRLADLERQLAESKAETLQARARQQLGRSRLDELERAGKQLAAALCGVSANMTAAEWSDVDAAIAEARRLKLL